MPQALKKESLSMQLAPGKFRRHTAQGPTVIIRCLTRRVRGEEFGFESPHRYYKCLTMSGGTMLRIQISSEGGWDKNGTINRKWSLQLLLGPN